MADVKPSRPRLVSAEKGIPEAGLPAPSESEAPPKRRAAFWLLAALAVAAVVALGVQTERVRALQSSNATLEGELFTTRAALAAYTDRFAVVRDTVAGLQAQLDALNSLVSEDPVPSERVPAESIAP